MSRALRSGIARVSPDGRSSIQRAFRAFAAPIAKRFGGTLPSELKGVVREAWRCDCELDNLAVDLARARERKRRTDERRLRRAIAGTRRDYARLIALIDARAAELPPVDWFMPQGDDTQ